VTVVPWREPGTEDRVAGALRAGLAVVIPTDTVYGLAADVSVAGATARLFAIKERPFGLDLPVLADGVEQALSLADEARVPVSARRLMDAFWPGPLTIVLARHPGLDADLGASAGTVGVRWADHPVPAALCRTVGPLATTSANLHGRPTPPTAAGVTASLGGRVALVVDGGRCAGAPSTVVDCTGDTPRLLREGRLAWGDVEAAAVRV
jgi:L-threonylcarbamoyladenylate synthase